MEGFTSIASITTLKSLNIIGCSVDTTIFTSLLPLATQLKKLEIGYYFISKIRCDKLNPSSINNFLSNCTNLICLNLCHHDLVEPLELPQLSLLEELSVPPTLEKPETCSQKLPNLKKLVCENYKKDFHSFNIIPFLSSFQKLESLSIQTGSTNMLNQILPECKALKYVSIPNFSILNFLKIKERDVQLSENNFFYS